MNYTIATTEELDYARSYQQRRIVCAAMRNTKGSIVCGARHHDAVMRSQIDNTDAFEYDAWQNSEVEQGFIDQRGVFLTREEAFEVALAAGQIVRRCGGDFKKLFSENLY